MPAWVGPAIAGGASVLGGVLGNIMSAEESERNRQFQAMMSNTSHQREVADLRKAGLNPMLSYHSGASTPSGSQAQQSDPVSGAVSSALAAKELDSRIGVNDAQIQSAMASANRDNTTAKQTAVQTEIMKKTAPAQIGEAELRIKELGYDKEAVRLRKYNQWLGEGLGTINKAKDAIAPPIFRQPTPYKQKNPYDPPRGPGQGLLRDLWNKRDRGE